MVLFFLNVRIAGIFFENCTDFFKTNVRIFSKIVRIVRISSENVRIFCTDFFKKVLATLYTYFSS